MSHFFGDVHFATRAAECAYDKETKSAPDERKHSRSGAITNPE